MSEQGSVNRKYAELRGYFVEWRYSEADKAFGWVLVGPTAADRGVLCTRPEYAWSAVADIEHSLDAVAAELAGKNVTLWLDFKVGHAVLSDWNDKRMEALEYHCASVGKVDAVEAAARALLAWAEAQRGEGV